MELQVKNKKGENVSSINASDSVWNAEPNSATLHQAVNAQLANKRQGTHDTLSRIDVQYSTIKLRAQKHTGRSRLGSRGSPSMGGSVAHGPHPRDYRQALPKKMRRLALRVALSDKVRANQVTVLDALAIEKPRTKDIRDVIAALGLKGHTLIVTQASDQNIVKSAANFQGVEIVPARQLSPLQAIASTNIVITVDAVKVVDGLWATEGAAK